MSAHEGRRAERRLGEPQPSPDGPPTDAEVGAGDEADFLDTLVWALDGLQRHTARRGHAGLAQALAAVCTTARAELDAARPRPAEVASARMRALWRQEGRS